MGKNTEAKIRKVIGTQRFRRIQEDNGTKVPAIKSDIPKVKPPKIETEDSQSKKTTIILIVLFFGIAGLGVYFKILTNKKPAEEPKSITELFGTPPKDDKMLEPTKLTKDQLREYVWLDDPCFLASKFEIISFFRAKFPQVRIEIKECVNSDEEIPLRNIGDMLTCEYRIIDIQDPVVFLSDKDGKMLRLVDPKNWNIAASIYGWKKNLYGNPDEEINHESEGMTPEEAAITFGDFELVNPTKEQVAELRAWSNANPDYRFEEFESKCSRLGVVYKLKLGSTMGGLLKPKASNGK